MSAVKKFRTKPVEITAIRFESNYDYVAVWHWTGGGFKHADKTKYLDPEIVAEVWDFLHATWVGVKFGQWIVKGAKGEFYPCDDETFLWKYEEVL